VLQRIRLIVMVWLMLPGLVLAAAPDIRLKDMDGNDHHVSEFIGQGKWTIVVSGPPTVHLPARYLPHDVFPRGARGKPTLRCWACPSTVKPGATRPGLRQRSEPQCPSLLGEPGDPGRLSGTMFIGTPTYYVFSPRGIHDTAHRSHDAGAAET